MRDMSHIATPCKQTSNRNIFVQRVPVDAPGAEFIAVTLFRGGMQQARKPCQRYTEGSAIVKLNPHGDLIEADIFS
ncbi:hypothetical protein ASF13_01555 [Erwinia sp. Leaf53]|nr:hypothetical protein ASF13_01555 [Erwinia sp. Leaf53]